MDFFVEDSRWDLVSQKPLVSVLIVAYNHERYISDCLKAVAGQQCDFPWEIVLVEDCSTDRTYEICDAFRQKYPALVRLIRGRHNVGMMRNFTRGIRACRGEFIAICEGDDFWTDKDKLTLQARALISNSSLDLCLHAADFLGPDGDRQAYWNYSHQANLLNALDIFDAPFSPMVPTASLMLRKTCLEPEPKWMSAAPVADLFLALAGVARGGACYIPRRMSVYRYMSVGSWTANKIPFVSDLHLEHERRLTRAAYEACKDYRVPRSYFRKRLAVNNWIGFVLSVRKGRFYDACSFISRVPLAYVYRGVVRRICRALPQFSRSEKSNT